MEKKRLLFFNSCLAVLVMLLVAPHSQASVTLNSTNFPDDNFRAALASALSISDGASFDETSLTTLDVSEQGITNLTGLELLTGLVTLDISDNSSLTTGADISGLTALRTLKASNCNLRDLSQTTITSSGTTYSGLVLGSDNSGLKYLDLSNNENFYYGGNLQYLTGLETLLLKGCTNFDYWGPAPGTSMSSLKYVDVSNCTAMDRVFIPAATTLEHLNASGTLVYGFSSSASSTATTQYYITLSSTLGTNGTLEYLNLADCASLKYFKPLYTGYGVASLDTLILTNDTGLNGWSSGITAQTGLKYCDLSNTVQTSSSIGFTADFTSLETLILANNSDFGYNSTFQYLSGLKYLDISGCDLYFREGTSSAYYLLHYLTPSYNPNLETLIANNSNMGSLTEGLDGFTNLRTVNVANNTSMTQFWVNGSESLDTLDISGNTAMTYLKLNDDGLPRNTFTLIGGADCTALTSLYLNDNDYSSVTAATSDFSSLSNLAFLYLENNSGFSGSDLTLSTSDCGTLKGIDLCNNGLTSFTAESLPSTLTALMLGDNPSMTRLEMHNNPGINTITTSTTMSDGSGLYLLGNTALSYMDISGTSEQQNYFSSIGSGSLSGLPVATFNAANNPSLGWPTGITDAASTLTYCDLSNTGQTSSTLGFTDSFTGLQTLILADNSSFGYSSTFQYLSGLKYLDASNCDLYFREGDSSDGYRLLHYLTPTNNPNLETLLASNSNMGQYTEGLDNFANLKTVDVSDNTGMTQFWVNGSPLLESLDISGNTAMTYLKLNDDGLPRSTFTLTGGADCTALASLYLNDNNYSSVADATSDFSSLEALAFLYLENNNGFDGGDLTLSASDCGNLTGIDLGNNGFTSFTAESLPSTLTALMLGDNPDMTRLEMHNNPGITTMTADATMSDGSGLYLLGNTALTYMDISGTAEQPNYFRLVSCSSEALSGIAGEAGQ